MPTSRRKLNDRIVKSLKPGSKSFDVYDTDQVGLVLRVTPSGRKVWHVRGRLRVAGESRGADTWRVLGEFHAEQLNTKQARDRAYEYRAAFKAGEDPAAPPPPDPSTKTLGEVWKDYQKAPNLKNRKPRKASGLQHATTLWNTHLSHWEDMPLSAITADEVKALLRKIRDGWVEDGKRYGGDTAANRVRSLLSAMWGISGVDAPNPTTGSELTKRGHEVLRKSFVPRERLAAFLAAVDALGLDFADAVRLGLCTGLRRANLLGLRWQWLGELYSEAGGWDLRPGELDGKRPGVLVPAEYTKTGKVLKLPLVAQAVEILERRKEGAKSAYVFPSDGSESGHMEERRRMWLKLAEHIVCRDADGSPREDPRPGWHVLRQTLARTLNGMAPATVVMDVLGHSRKRLGVVSEYTGEADPDLLRTHLERAVAEIFSGGKVLPFSKKNAAGQ